MTDSIEQTMVDDFEVPENWNLSPQQECVIGSLIDDAGTFITAQELCEALYGEMLDKDAPAPAKLRVLMQRCRSILREVTQGTVSIETKRGFGWRITRRGRAIIRDIVADV